MALERVLMWSEDSGWNPISVEKAAVLCRGGSVSANSGIFMCGKCHKYVYFADGKVKGRYFGHSRGDKDEDKECEDRSHFYEVEYDALKDPKYSYKIELNRKNFCFYIGLLLTPDINPQGTFDIISSKGNLYTFNFDRFYGNFDYFNVGRTPAEEYRISTGEISVKSFPQKVIGIRDGIAVFKADSGKKIPDWANVQVNNEYFLLSKGQFTRFVSSSVSHHLICESNGYFLYSIRAERFDYGASKFFCELHCILTNQSPLIMPIWPVYRRSPYIMYHNSDKCFVLMSGEEVNPKVFPNRIPIPKYCSLEQNAVLAWVNCTGRELVLALDRDNPQLKQIIMWRDNEEYLTSCPRVFVMDFKERELTENLYSTLPYQNKLLIETVFDGFVIVYVNNIVYEKREIKSGCRSAFYNIRFGSRLEIFEGLDKVRIIEFKWNCSCDDFDEKAFVKSLEKCSDKLVPIPYNLSGIAKKLKDYPEIQRWIRIVMKNGYISEKSFKLLSKLVLTLEAKND
ncbi:MAG: hypothetical protein HDT42_04690 [Ruminococcaceae bacterium]|nr:hypothetical protein [Oscillospiraceae bacterium]